jgi:hypothetical protein
MSLVHVQNFSLSLDGFGTGEGRSRDHPFGHADERLHEWMFETRWWSRLQAAPGEEATDSPQGLSVVLVTPTRSSPAASPKRRTPPD